MAVADDETPLREMITVTTDDGHKMQLPREAYTQSVYLTEHAVVGDAVELFGISKEDMDPMQTFMMHAIVNPLNEEVFMRDNELYVEGASEGVGATPRRIPKVLTKANLRELELPQWAYEWVAQFDGAELAHMAVKASELDVPPMTLLLLAALACKLKQLEEETYATVFYTEMTDEEAEALRKANAWAEA